MSRPKGGAATRICEDVCASPRPSLAAGPALHPEGAAGPVVARLVLVVVLVRRHACGGPRGARRTRDGRAGARWCVWAAARAVDSVVGADLRATRGGASGPARPSRGALGRRRVGACRGAARGRGKRGTFVDVVNQTASVLPAFAALQRVCAGRRGSSSSALVRSVAALWPWSTAPRFCGVDGRRPRSFCALRFF